MSILAWILLGLAAGYLATYFHKGPRKSSLITTMLIGIAGALVGGWLGDFTGIGDVTGLNLRSVAIATMGAVLCLWAYERTGRR